VSFYYASDLEGAGAAEGGLPCWFAVEVYLEGCRLEPGWRDGAEFVGVSQLARSSGGSEDHSQPLRSRPFALTEDRVEDEALLAFVDDGLLPAFHDVKPRPVVIRRDHQTWRFHNCGLSS